MFDAGLAALLGIAVSTRREARKLRTWPFVELPRIGRKPPWSREHVLSVINRKISATVARREPLRVLRAYATAAYLL